MSTVPSGIASDTLRSPTESAGASGQRWGHLVSVAPTAVPERHVGVLKPELPVGPRKGLKKES